MINGFYTDCKDGKKQEAQTIELTRLSKHKNVGLYIKQCI